MESIFPSPTFGIKYFFFDVFIGIEIHPGKVMGIFNTNKLTLTTINDGKNEV